MEYLYQKLEKYENEDYYPFHMPGHKRNKELKLDTYGIDITEIDGFDNLHCPEDIILEAQKRAAVQFGAEETFFLVNGSSCGILAAISAMCNDEQSSIIVARNSHKAVYHAILLNRAQATYLYPEYEKNYHINGGIAPETVRKALQDCMADCSESARIEFAGGKPAAGKPAAVVITSPTYDGIVSDIEKIAAIVHEQGIPLIVDEAHGAHFPLDPMAPQSAIQAGADIVIQSVHKTLPSLTQTSLLHVQGNLVDRERLKKYLQIYQSSSPSYVLMASIDKCLHMMQDKGRTLFEEFHRRRAGLTERLKGLSETEAETEVEAEVETATATEIKAIVGLRALRLFGREQIGHAAIADYDTGKILISTAGTSITGKELYELLRTKYHLQLEMAAPDYVVAIMTVMDTQEGIDRLVNALLEIDASVTLSESSDVAEVLPMACCQNRQKMTIADSFYREHKTIALEQSEGHVAAEFVYAYPPGIPVLVPGEVISSEVLSCIREYQQLGLSIQGLADRTLDTIQVLA